MRRRHPLLGSVLCCLLCFASLVSCTYIATPERGAVILPTDGWVLYVRSEGPYWIGGEWWRDMGVDRATRGYESVQLKKGDVNIPYIWIADGDELGMLFYAEVTPTRTGSWGSYTLQIGKPGLAMEKHEQTVSSAAECQDTSFESVVYEQNNDYRSTAPLEYPWFWTSLRPPDSITLTIPLTQSITGPVTVTTQMWGQSRMPQNPDHHIRLVWDDAEISDHFWDGNSIEGWDVEFLSGDKAIADLVITSPGETEAPVELNWLDTVTITWRKSLEWTGEGWERWLPEDEAEVCWKNNTGDALIGLLIAEDGTVFQADMAGIRIPQTGALRGWIGTPTSAPAPAFVRNRQLVSMDALNETEYLVIASQAFHEALAPLLEKRSSESLSVLLVTPEQVYDTYGQGIPSETAINAMVTALAQEGNLRYLLLVGDTSSGGDVLTEELLLGVPTGWVQTSVLGDTPSDFALVSDEGTVPKVAVGRFPANDEEEVANIVQKTLDWSSNDRILFVGDDEVEFDSFIDRLAEVTPIDQRLSAGDLNARQSLLSWLREGPGIMVYSGHGSLPMLGDEKILTQQDAGSWDGPTVVIAWSCLCASFTHPSYEGLGETWMTSKQGTVAFVGPTGETTSGQQQAMAVAVQEALVEGIRIGDALLQGWRVAQSADAQASFLLLGDPALVPFASGSE